MAGCAAQPMRPFTTVQPTAADMPLETSIRITGFEQSLLTGDAGRTAYLRKPCEMTITQPKHMNDYYAFCVLGHEVWHCLTGNFHEGEDVRCGWPEPRNPDQ
jgi:hypothetical protein